MNVLVTGAKGMVGTALCNNLKNVRDGKNRTRPGIVIDEIYEYDLNSNKEELDIYCQNADFVFNLAGVNRPEDSEDFMKGNFGFAADLLNNLKKYENKAPIIFRPNWQAASVTPSMVAPRRLGRSCSLTMLPKPVQRSPFTVFRI